MKNSVIAWLCFSVFSVALGGMLMSELTLAESKPNFVPGEMSHGHAQIELACNACHEKPFGGALIQDACEGCHLDALKVAQDTHPKTKFTDPRNADRLEQIDARECVACHLEHVEEQTFAMGVTLPEDFCYLCHEEIAKDRPSHEGMGFDTCANSGCHNYHDNRALYENFLLQHTTEPDVLETIRREFSDQKIPKVRSVNAAQTITMMQASDPVLIAEVSASKHGTSNVECAHCHETTEGEIEPLAQLDVCGSCHEEQQETFTLGKHGMRLALGLPAMRPNEARLPMHEANAHEALDCGSCHDPHSVDINFAKTESCLGCHADDHSSAFQSSPHALLTDEWEVTCSSCHMPKVEKTEFGITHSFTTHNQSENFQPNEQMIRSVCMDCHGLSFSINALADPNLIQNNFNGQPQQHVESLDMAIERDQPK